MDAALENAVRLLRLAAPAALGLTIGWAGVFPEQRQAVAVLNTYALTVGFPALIAFGLIDAQLALPTQPAFYLIWPCALMLTLVAIALLGGVYRGTAALVASFGNVAYLGLPLAIATLGDSASGAAALAVSIHVALSVTVGPALLERWSPQSDDAPTSLLTLARRLARLPLFWAPFAGLAARALPTGPKTELLAVLGPIAASAAPVALFLLGLYLYQERSRLVQFDGPLAGHIALCLLITPALTFALALGATTTQQLDPTHAQLHVLLASMPAAITTFAIAHQANVGSERVAGTIAWSTLGAAVTIPIWASLARWAFG